METHGVVMVEDHQRIGTNSNVSTVVGTNIPNSSVGNFMGTHMIYLLVVFSVEDPVVVEEETGLVALV